MNTGSHPLYCCYAESDDGLHWRKCRRNPVLTQGEPGTWDGGWIYARDGAAFAAMHPLDESQWIADPSDPATEELQQFRAGAVDPPPVLESVKREREPTQRTAALWKRQAGV